MEIQAGIETAQLLSGKWRVRILGELMAGDSLRFSELQRALKTISRAVLAVELRDLEQKGLVDRKVLTRFAPHVEYSLTPVGRSLRPILELACEWGAQYAHRDSPPLP